MQQVTKTLSDIFSMGFDIIIPLSGCIVAFLFALLLFFIRYATFNRNKRRFARRQHAEEVAARSALEEGADASAGSAVRKPAAVDAAAKKPVRLDAAIAGIITSAMAQPRGDRHISARPELDRHFCAELDAAIREYTHAYAGQEPSTQESP